MQDMTFVIAVNGIVFLAWLILFLKDRKKGTNAIRIGFKTIFSMVPFLFIIMALIGLFGSFLNPDIITKYLGAQAGWKGFVSVALVSSLLQIPGIVIFPIAEVLLKNGATAGIVSLFICASTMASIFTFPLEAKFLGKKIPIVRIPMILIISICIGILTGLIFKLL